MVVESHSHSPLSSHDDDGFLGVEKNIRSNNSSDTRVGEMDNIDKAPARGRGERADLSALQEKDISENDLRLHPQASYSSINPKTRRPFRRKFKPLFTKEGKLRPFRLLKQDVRNIRRRYLSDWTTFNQLVFASAVYVFFTNLLPGITFASDLYQRTGKSWGTIEVVFSTGLCGTIFSL